MPSRKLTKGEIELARTIYGDHINYEEPRIFRGERSAYFMPIDRVHAPDGNIYFPPGAIDRYHSDFSKTGTARDKALFIHELAHVWQHQNGVPLSGDVLFQATLLKPFGGDPYDYASNMYKDSTKLPIEAQAQVMSDLYLRRVGQAVSPLLDRFIPDMNDPNISTKMFAEARKRPIPGVANGGP